MVGIGTGVTFKYPGTLYDCMARYNDDETLMIVLYMIAVAVAFYFFLNPEVLIQLIVGVLALIVCVLGIIVGYALVEIGGGARKEVKEFNDF